MKLLTLRAYIDFIDNDMQEKNKKGICDLRKESFDWLLIIVKYNDYLKQKLTVDDFIGDKAVFVGFKEKKSSLKLIVHQLYTDNFSILFHAPYNHKVNMQAYCIKPNGYDTYNLRFIKTFADLAEMTKDNPLKLR